MQNALSNRGQRKRNRKVLLDWDHMIMFIKSCNLRHQDQAYGHFQNQKLKKDSHKDKK